MRASAADQRQVAVVIDLGLHAVAEADQRQSPLPIGLGVVWARASRASLYNAIAFG